MFPGSSLTIVPTKIVSSEACEDHICQSDSCARTRRHHRPYCKEHVCAWSGRLPCNQEVEAGSRACRDHACQFEGGCLNVRKVKTNGQACDEHTCRIASCYKAIGIRGKYCRDHTCTWEPCSQRGGYGGSPYCDTHKCGTPKCPAPVASKVDTFCGEHKCPYGGGRCLGGWTKSPPFCSEHTCSVKGCHDPVDWHTDVCPRHVNYQPPEPKKPSSVTSHKKRDSKPKREAYVEVEDPSSGSCDEHDEHATRHGSSKKGKKGSKHDDHHESNNGVLVRRADLQVSTAVHGEVAVRPDIASYAVARREGKNVPTPEIFRTDPNFALAYGCGMQDAVHMMADLWKSGAFSQSGASQGGQFVPQAAFAQGSFAEMDRHLPKFEGARVVEEEGG